MLFDTKSFGKIQVEEDKKIIFREGIPGFENLKEYILIEDEDVESPFCYLQSVEDGDISFIITNPYVFKEDYEPQINESYFEKLGGGEDSEFSVFVIVTINGDIETATLNLMGPLIIHNTNRLGIQAIIEGNTYTTKHKIVELLKERG